MPDGKQDGLPDVFELVVKKLLSNPETPSSLLSTSPCFDAASYSSSSSSPTSTSSGTSSSDRTSVPMQDGSDSSSSSSSCTTTTSSSTPSSDTTSILTHDVSSFEIKAKAFEKDMANPVPKELKPSKFYQLPKLLFYL